MNKIIPGGKFALLLTLIIAVLTACGNGSALKTSGLKDSSGNSVAAPNKVSTEPVTLQMFQSSTKITDEQFNDLIADPVKKKYPYITVELVRGTMAKAEEMVAAGDFPDMIFTGLGSVPGYRNLGLLADMNEVVKKTNFDLSVFQPRIIDQIKVYGEKGELYAIPYLENFSALFYNKDAFDKYGEPYPKDSLMWDDVIALARKLSAKSTNGDYMPLCPGSLSQFASPLSLPVVDPKTNKAVLDTDLWKMVLEKFKIVQDIPGNACKGDAKEVEAFENGTLAMMAGNGARLGEFEEMAHQGKTINWDLATYPQFKEAPGKRRRMDITLLMTSTTSKHPDQVFQVIEAISTRDQQIKRTRSGQMSTYKDPALRKDFAADFKTSQGKNLQGIFKTEPSKMMPYTDYNGLANKRLNDALNDVLKGTDANSALRSANEAANLDITAALEGK